MRMKGMEMGKTFTVRKESVMAQVTDAKLMPIRGAIIGLALDAKKQGTVLAHEVFAALKQQHGTWVTFAHRVFAFTHDAREAFVASVKTQLQEIMRNNMHTHGMSKKDAGKEVRSSIVQVSRLVKIANAAQKGASLAGCGSFYGIKDPEHVGYNRVYNYAVDYLKAQGANKGRPVSALVTKLHKWLDVAVEVQSKAQRSDEMVALDKATATQLRILIARLTPEATE